MEMAPVELYWAFHDRKDTIKNQEEANNSRTKLICEVVRLSTMQQLNIRLPRMKKIRDPKKVMKFPWDIVKVQTIEEMRNAMKFIAAAFKNKKPRKRIIGRGK